MSEDKLDPRQQAFLAYYLDPTSDTYSNCLQSAIKAGYKEEYAQNMTALMPDWLSESIGKLNMLKKAERNLAKFLDFEQDPKIQQDTTKFVAERLGRRDYSTKQEIAQTNLNLNKDVSSLTDEELDKLINS